MEIVFEVLIQFLGEILFQFFGEWLAELGLRSLREPFRPPAIRNPVLVVFGYGIFGAITGGLSLLVRSTSFLHHPQLRLANLILAPVLLGLLMRQLGLIRQRRGKVNSGLEHFLFAWSFAAAFALVRYLAIR